MAPTPPPQQTIWPLVSRPGIKRDGTALQGDAYTDGVWCRFQRGLPRKMGGYKQLSTNFSGPVRGCFVNSTNGSARVFAGSAAALEFLDIPSSGTVTGITDRTPAGFATSTNNVWQFDAMYDATSAKMVLIAHGAPNLAAIDNTTAEPVYYGDITASTALTSVGQSVAGGACVLYPYLFLYDANGFVKWSDANTPATFVGGDSGSARITGAKIVKGLVTRGGPTNSPAGLFWSLDSVIRASYVGGTAIFRFDTISDQSSILSSSGVIEHDGIFYWPGVDRFLMYNGVVQEVPNDMNINWFFDNLNWTYRQKVWAMKVPRYGEIWWFYPRGNSTECNDAIILNVREDTWYDAGSAVGAARSAGIYSGLYRYPLMFGTSANALSKYQLFQHESGVDNVTADALGNPVANAIQSYFETRDMSWPGTGAGDQWVGIDRWMRLTSIEPDFVQSGDMKIYVIGREFPQSSDETITPNDFLATDTKVDLKEQERFLRLRFESNVAGGDYQTGQTLLHLGMGDARR